MTETDGPRQRGRDVHGRGLDVGFVCAGWPPDVGGIESHAQDLARELSARGHRVHVLCMDASPGLEPYGVKTSNVDGVEVRRMAYAYADYDRLARMARNPKAEDVVTAWMAETPCDVIHVHHATGFGMGALRAIDEVGAALVMTLHDYWPLCPRGQMLRSDGSVCARPETDACGPCLAETFPGLMPSDGGCAEGPEDEPLANDGEAAAARTAFALEMLELPARLLTPSAAARDVYVAAGVAPDRIVVCANGVDVAGLAQEVARLRIAAESDECLRLGILGSVLPSKGVLELAHAFVRANVPGLSLEVHGDLPSYHGDDSYVRALEELASTRPDLTVHGAYARADLPAILARLHGVAAPSRWQEVFGLTVREARAAGLPVLVSDAGGLPEVATDVHEGVERAAGLVVPRDDEDAWVDALRRFASDEGARRAWASAPSTPRTSHNMMLELERAYVDVVVEATGREPDLMVPIEYEVAEPRKRGLLARLFGRD